MGSRQDPEQTFPFLRLPLEVRHAVYNILLCNPPPPSDRRADMDDIDTQRPETLQFLNHIKASILLVNHQIYSEAREAMLRGNQFVRIRSRGRVFELVEEVCRQNYIPVLKFSYIFREQGTGRPNYDTFCVMTHHIVWGNSIVGESEKWEYEDEESSSPLAAVRTEKLANIIILRRDLAPFCEALATQGIIRRKGFDTRSRHTLKLHNPFRTTSSPNFMGDTNTERLLAPYRTHFRGFTHVRIRGAAGGTTTPVSPRLTAALEARIAQPVPVPDQHAVLADLRLAKDTGNAFYRARRYRQAAEAYTRGCTRALLAKSRACVWNAIRDEPGAGFREALAMLYFQVCLNRIQNMLAWAQHETTTPLSSSSSHQQDQNHRRLLLVLHAKAEALSFRAQHVARKFHARWTPTLAQMAKHNYRMACVERVMGSMVSAKKYIDVARLQSPGDPIILREAEEITALL